MEYYAAHKNECLTTAQKTKDESHRYNKPKSKL